MKDVDQRTRNLTADIQSLQTEISTEVIAARDERQKAELYREEGTSLRKRAIDEWKQNRVKRHEDDERKVGPASPLNFF